MVWWMMLVSLTLNCNGLQKQEKWHQVWSLAKCTGAELITFQETHLTQQLENKFGLCAQAFGVFDSHGTSQSAAVLVAIKQNLGLHVKYSDKIEGHAICLDVQGESEEFWVISIYAPNEPR